MKVLQVSIIQDFASTLQVLFIKIFASMDLSSTFWQVVSMEIFASFMKFQKVFLQTFHERNILQVSEVIIVRGSVLVTPEPG